jgi:hypothetical protein
MSVHDQAAARQPGCMQHRTRAVGCPGAAPMPAPHLRGVASGVHPLTLPHRSSSLRGQARLTSRAVVSQVAGGQCPPHPLFVATLRGRSNGLGLPGCVLPGTGGRRPMAGACLGGLGDRRSSGTAPLACAWPLRCAVLERPRTIISARSCVKTRARATHLSQMGPRLDTRSLRLGFAASGRHTQTAATSRSTARGA